MGKSSQKCCLPKKEKNYWIKLGVVVFIQIFFRFLPNIGQITDFGMAVVGIFLGAIIGWCVCDPVWPSLTAIVLLGLTGYSTITKLVSSLFSNTSLLTVLLSFIFGGIVLSTGLSEWMSKWLLSRKMLRGRPWLLTLFIILTMWLIGNFTGIALLILLWEVVYSIAEQANMTRDNNTWPTIMVFSLLLVVAVGVYFSWGFGPVAVFGLAAAVDPTVTLEPWPFLIYGIIVSLLLVGTGSLANFLIFKPDVSALKNVSLDEPPQITKKQKVTLWLIGAFVIAMVVPSMLPSSWSATVWLKQFGTIGTLVVAIFAAMIIRIDGEPLVTMDVAASKGIAWGPIFMMGTALVVAGALTSDSTGVTSTLTALLMPIFSGMSPFAFAAVVIILTVVFTNLLNNIVVAAIFVTIIYSMKDLLGINPYPLLIVMSYSTYLAVLLPSANPITTVMFGCKDKIKSKDIFKYAGVSIMTGLIVLIFVAYPLATLIYG